MRVFELMNGYLWIMMFIESLVLIYIDHGYYKEKGSSKNAKISRTIGYSLIFIFTVIYITNRLFFS